MTSPPQEQPPQPDAITRAGRLIGLGGIVVSAIFWFVTAATTGNGQVSTELLGVFGSLWGFTEGAAAVKDLRRR